MKSTRFHAMSKAYSIWLNTYFLLAFYQMFGFNVLILILLMSLKVLCYDINRIDEQNKV